MSEEPKLYDEEKTIPDFWSWVILIIFSASIVGYGIFAYIFVKDAPRRWDYGTLPDVPAQSIYNTKGPARPAEAPRQIPLPAAPAGASK